MSEAVNRARPLHHLVALLCPLLVLAWGARWLTAPPEDAGLSKRAAAMEARLAERQPRVVVVSNSSADRAIDTKALATSLGVAETEVEVIIETGSRAPAWYALLDNRVYRAGHRPELVLVVGEYRWMLETGIHADWALSQIQDHLGEDPGVVGALTFGRDSQPAWLRRARVRAGKIRTATLESVRDWTVGVLLAEPGEQSTMAAGHHHAVAAMERLFGSDSAVDMDLHTRVVPVVEVDKGALPERSGPAVPLDSYVPAFIDLAEQYGSRIAFVRVPVRSDNNLQFAVDIDTRRELVRLLNERGAGWVDLSELPGLSDRHFADAVHLNLQGRAIFTTALAEALDDLDAMGEGAFEPATLPERPPAAERLGSPNPLPAEAARRTEDLCLLEVKLPGLAGLADVKLGNAGFLKQSPVTVSVDGVPLANATRIKDLGQACDGVFAQAYNHKVLVAPPDAEVLDAPERLTLGLTDALPIADTKGNQAWWVYPGTSVRFTWDEPLLPGEQPLTARVEALGIGEGTGVPTLTVGSTSAPLDASTTVWQGSVENPARADTVSVSSPPDGPFLLISSLSVEASDATRWPVLPVRAGPSQLAIAGSKSVGVPTYGPPPRLRTLPQQEQGQLFTVDIPQLEGLDPADVSRVAGKACTVVQVLRDGEPLKPPEERCKPGEDAGRRWTCHQGTTVGWMAAKRGGPVEVTLDPERRCRSNWWLYPGDTATFTLGPKLLRGQPLITRALALEAASLGTGEADALVHIELTLDGTRVLDTRLPLSQLTTRQRLPLDPPVVGIEALQLELSTEPGARWMLLKQAALE